MKRRMRRATSSTITALAVLAGLIAIGLATRPAMAQGVHQITGTTDITAAGKYFVTADFTGYITIEASNVDLDLGGHTITVPANFLDGILVIGIATTNVRISNGTVHGFPYGVPFSPSGIELMGGGGCHVSNMTIIRFLSGINLEDYGGDSINANVCSSNGAGISLQSSSNSIRGNVCSNNYGQGIGVLSQSNSITGNVCSSNRGDGIVVLSGAHSNSIKGNTALGNGNGNFAVDLEDYNPNCDSNTWVGNTFVTSEAYDVHQPSCIR